MVLVLSQIAELLTLVVERGNHALSSPWVSALQFHGVWLSTLLATLWVVAGKKRLQELQRQQRGMRRGGGSLAALAAAEQEVRAWHDRMLWSMCKVQNHAAASAILSNLFPPIGAGGPDQAAAGDGGAACAGVPQPQRG